jgi:hypothetical protein
MSTVSPRPGWIARITGHQFDLMDWERSLKAPFDPVCERMQHSGDTIWVVRSATLDRLETDSMSCRCVSRTL